MNRRLGAAGIRRGLRGPGGGAPIAVVSAPILGGATYAGGSPAITPPVYSDGGAPDSYSLLVNGVEVESGNEATIEAYVYTTADEGNNAIVRAIRAGVADSDSDAVAIAAPVLAALTGTIRARFRADAYNAGTGTCTDTSGEGNHATQATSGSRPTLGTANGRAAMVFDGTDDRLQTAAFAGGACTLPTTIFAVANRTGANGVSRILCDGRLSTNRNVIWWKPTNVWGMLGNTDIAMSGGDAADNTVSAFACTFNGASSVGFFDDWETDICTGNPGSQVLDGITLGAAFSGSAGWIGTVNEIIVVEGATDDDVLAVREYFRTYYSLSFLA